MSIRIAEMNIPSLLTLETATAGNRQIKISDALVNYHHLKGIGRDVLFFTTSTRFVGHMIDILGDRHIGDYSSSDAAALRDHLFDRGLSSSSVRRAFAFICAVISLAIKEHGLNCSTSCAAHLLLSCIFVSTIRGFQKKYFLVSEFICSKKYLSP